MHVLEANGSYGILIKRTVVSGAVWMYNLTVAQDHTYTVGLEQVVVHNDSDCLDPNEIWHKGSFDSAQGSAEYHFAKHGAEVGAEDVQQYLRKALGKSQSLRGAKSWFVDGAVDSAKRYVKSGKYIDLSPDGLIISFGRQ